MGIKERKEREKDILRERILAAAEDLFLTKGFADVSMRKIAAKIEYSATTIYNYFKNKEEMLHALIRNYYQDFMLQVAAGFEESTDPYQNLSNILKLYVKVGAANPEKYRLLLSTYSKFGHADFTSGKYLGFEFITKTIEECVEKDIFRELDVQITAQSLWIMVYGLLNMIITRPEYSWWKNKDALIEHSVDTMLAGLKK